MGTRHGRRRHPPTPSSATDSVPTLAVALAAGITAGAATAADPEKGKEIYGRCLACHAIEYDRVGVSGENVGLTSLVVRTSAQSRAAYLRVHNFGQQARTVTVEWRSDAGLIDASHDGGHPRAGRLQTHAPRRRSERVARREPNGRDHDEDLGDQRRDGRAHAPVAVARVGQRDQHPVQRGADEAGDHRDQKPSPLAADGNQDGSQVVVDEQDR